MKRRRLARTEVVDTDHPGPSGSAHCRRVLAV